jgi:hypothetical protein
MNENVTLLRKENAAEIRQNQTIKTNNKERKEENTSNTHSNEYKK